MSRRTAGPPRSQGRLILNPLFHRCQIMAFAHPRSLLHHPVMRVASDEIVAVQPTSGFFHKWEVVYALQYDLEYEPPKSLCLFVWVNLTDDATAAWILPADPRRRIVTTKPGSSSSSRANCRRSFNGWPRLERL